MIVVSDTSPVLNLARIGRLDLLPTLYQQVEIFRRTSPVEPHLKCVPAFQHPRVVHWLALVEHPRKQSIERDLAPQTMEINGVATGPFEQACFEGRP